MTEGNQGNEGKGAKQESRVYVFPWVFWAASASMLLILVCSDVSLVIDEEGRDAGWFLNRSFDPPTGFDTVDLAIGKYVLAWLGISVVSVWARRKLKRRSAVKD